MALDPALPLAVKPIQLPDPLEAAGKGLTLRNLINQGRIQEAELAQLPMKNHLATLQARAGLAKAETDQRKSLLEEIKSRAEILGHFAASVKASGYDPNAWQSGKAWLKAQGAPDNLLASLPDSPDPVAIDAMANRALSVNEALERGDYSVLNQTPGQDTQQAIPVQSADIPPEHEENVMQMQREMIAAGMMPSEQQMPQVTVEADAPADPDAEVQALLAEARRLENMKPLTKAALERADQLRRQAKDREELAFKKRDLYQPVGGGVTFNKSTNEYLIDGRKATAAEVQQIENTKAKSGATQIGIGDGALGLGKAAANKVDEGLLDSTARKQRLVRLEQSYKPEFLEIGTRLGNTWNAIKEKAGVGLSSADRTRLAEFTQWKQQALDNLNQYIKEITGAALSEPEARRIMASMPNPGQSWYDGDSPTQFKSGLDRIIRDLKTAEARLVYIKRNGLSLQDVPLERVPQIMRKRETELETEVKRKFPSATDGDRRQIIKAQLAQEFGLTAD